MDNQSTSGLDDFEELERLEEKIEICQRLNSCCLILSFLSHGMSISFAVVNLHKKNKFDDLSTAPLILSSLLIALQFFSSLLFVWCRFKFNRIFGGVIAAFTIFIQIAIIVLVCKYFHKSVLAASIWTSFVNLLLLISWSVLTICIVIKAFRKRQNPTSDDIQLDLPDSCDDQNQLLNPQSQTTSL
ncbi:MAG: hypothetical protein MHMPM18_005207 [Marteilia pararefringens]